jgi:hypothetical protein
MPWRRVHCWKRPRLLVDVVTKIIALHAPLLLSRETLPRLMFPVLVCDAVLPCLNDSSVLRDTNVLIG